MVKERVFFVLFHPNSGKFCSWSSSNGTCWKVQTRIFLARFSLPAGAEKQSSVSTSQSLLARKLVEKEGVNIKWEREVSTIFWLLRSLFQMSFLIVLFLVPSCLLAQNQRYVTVTTPQGAMQGAKLDYGTNHERWSIDDWLRYQHEWSLLWISIFIPGSSLCATSHWATTILSQYSFSNDIWILIQNRYEYIFLGTSTDAAVKSTLRCHVFERWYIRDPFKSIMLSGRCPQAGVSPGPVSEDCLYLNIFTTQVFHKWHFMLVPEVQIICRSVIRHLSMQ